MIMIIQDKLSHDNSTLCYICNEELGKDRVRDHCHLSGKFRGAAHEACNLKYKVLKFFPVVFHNLPGYHSHLFTKHWEMARNIFLVYQIMKKITFFSTKPVIVDKFVNKDGKEISIKRKLRFIDSLRFMASSLDKLSGNLKIDQFVNLKKYYSGN